MEDPKLFPGYQRRATRVLFLSATPIEASYLQLWNQLDIFGLGGRFAELKHRDVTDEAKKQIVRQFLVRRVTKMQVNEKELTKNQYRREWRQGGVIQHDKPIQIGDPRKRLVVALVQKKVAELLGSGKFNMSFQIGMLASFESFLQTAKLKRDDDEGNFDDAEQKRELTDAQKEGVDVHGINQLARDYHKRFNAQMPHPKMDEVVDSLASAWLTGKKPLVFVRRVASVKELKQKLDERYDKWLIPFLKAKLPEAVRSRFDEIVELYGAASWMKVDATTVRSFLSEHGYEGGRTEGTSEANRCLLRLQSEQNVAYAAPLAGHRAGLHTINGKRVLVTESPRFIEPAPGAWPMIDGLA